MKKKSTGTINHPHNVNDYRLILDVDPKLLADASDQVLKIIESINANLEFMSKDINSLLSNETDSKGKRKFKLLLTEIHPDIWLLSDQPFTCPNCGSRTEDFNNDVMMQKCGFCNVVYQTEDED